MICTESQANIIDSFDSHKIMRLHYTYVVEIIRQINGNDFPVCC